ncbi:hypothetical protein ACB377_07775 [Klebsiella michiganensis]
MTNKASSPQDDIWTVIFKGLIGTVKMVFSIFAFFLSSTSSKQPEINAEDSESNGYRSYGYHSKSMKPDE